MKRIVYLKIKNDRFNSSYVGFLFRDNGNVIRSKLTSKGNENLAKEAIIYITKQIGSEDSLEIFMHPCKITKKYCLDKQLLGKDFNKAIKKVGIYWLRNGEDNKFISEIENDFINS